MKCSIVYTVFVVLFLFCDGAKDFEDLKRQLVTNPRLRDEATKTFAKILGNTLFLNEIGIRGNLLSVLSNGFGVYESFGTQLTLPELVRIVLGSIVESPMPGSVSVNYPPSNGDLNYIFAALRMVKKFANLNNDVDKDKSLVVNTTLGRVRGVRMNENDVKYIGFFNIPYATVYKRFQAPRPAKPWKGIRDAFRVERFCPQRVILLGQIAGAEDCLQLDIHVPSPMKKNRPVLVFVHGGGFFFGIGSRYFFHPDKLLKQDLIVVSFHYRLGALGFLSTGTKDAPGNAGLKDMVAALRWIKANIENFGGDPNSITLYGLSSAAIATEFLILSPMAKGLFNRAIMSSGSVFTEWAYTTDPLKYAFRLGREMGSNATYVKDLMRFLKKADPLHIIEAQEKIALIENPSGEFIPFVPCTEKRFPGVENFLPDHPENLMKSGKYNHVPVIMTFTDQEGLQIMISARTNPNYIRSIDKNLEYYLPNDVMDGLHKPEQKEEILNRIRQFYFYGPNATNNTIQNYVNFISDAKFLLGIQKSIKLRTNLQAEPIYYAEFAFDGDLNVFKYYQNLGIKGAAHADDLGYLFTLPLEKVYSNENSTSRLVSDRLVTMFKNFAVYGDPTPQKTKLLPVKWNPIQGADTKDYLRITDKLEMRQNPNRERYAFWDELYRLKKEMILNS